MQEDHCQFKANMEENTLSQRETEKERERGKYRKTEGWGEGKRKEGGKKR